MEFRTRIGVTVVVLFLISGSFTAARAASINILAQTYSITASTEHSFDHQTSATPPLAETLWELGGFVTVSSDGKTTSSSGFLSAGVDAEGGGGSAAAVLDFRPAMDLFITLKTLGGHVGGGWGEVLFRNLTENTTLLDDFGFTSDFDHWQIDGSYIFALDHSKTYRLEADGSAGIDVGGARVNYSVATATEPMACWLVLLVLPALVVHHIKHSKSGGFDKNFSGRAT